MLSTLCRNFIRSVRSVRSSYGSASKLTLGFSNHIFNTNINISLNSTPSRSWLRRKSNFLSFGNHSRKFSTFFAPREEQKTGSCCHAKQHPAQPQQTNQPAPTTINTHHAEHSHKHKAPTATDLSFWQDNAIWRRASSNTLRCLIGCSIGDFSAMFYLQTHHTGLPFLAMMAIPMASGIATSLGFETLVLRIKESMSWSQSLKTAWTMSLISMLTMEFVENIVDMYLTKGMMNFHDPYFWLALIPSLLAGFLAPLPYNYYKLKKFGKSCH